MPRIFLCRPLACLTLMVALAGCAGGPIETKTGEFKIYHAPATADWAAEKAQEFCVKEKGLERAEFKGRSGSESRFSCKNNT